MIALHLLVASDDPTTWAGRAHLDAALARGHGPVTSACVLGAAHGDDPRRLRLMTAGLSKRLGCEVSAPRLTDPGLDVEAARAAIEAAGVLYLDGGDTLHLAEAVRARGLEGALAKAARHARLIHGLSAGACAAAPYTVGYDDDDAPRVARCLALGLPWPADVHDEDDDWPEMRTLLELRPAKERGLVVPTGGAVLVDGTDAWSLAGAAELRWLEEDGRWGVERLPSSPPRR